MRDQNELDPSLDPDATCCPARGIVVKVVIAIHAVLGIGVGLAAWAKWS